MSDIYKSLKEPFPDEAIKQVRKGSANLDYIPVSEVVNRLNTVLGVGNWSYYVDWVHRDATDPDFVIASVKLEGTIEGVFFSRAGLGGQKINRKSSGDIVDLGDDFKGAVSDALKKAASTLGVGLYLSREVDAMEAEVAIAAPPPAPVDPEIDAAYRNMLGHVKALNKEQNTELNAWWTEYSGGRPKPTVQVATLAEIEAIQAEAIRITFAGSEVSSDASE